MTVSNTKSFNEYTSTGTETVWSFTFDVSDPSQVKVYEIDDNNIRNDVTTGATVDIVAKTVTYGPIASGHKIRIERVTPATQEVDLSTQGPFLPQVLEDALDKLTYISQEARNLADEVRDVVAKDIKFAGEWIAGTTYKENQAVTRYGNLYVCKTTHVADSTNGPVDGQSNAYWAIATKKGEAFKWKGPWTSGSSYTPNDAVESGGSTYICKTAHTSSSSDEPGVGANWSTYWDLSAQKGADGTGDVNGPASATDGNIAIFDGTTGKLLKDSSNTVTNIRLVDALPTLYMEETDTTTAAQIILTNGDLTIQVGAPGSGAAASSGDIAICGYNYANIASIKVKYGGAWHDIWHQGNFASRIAALTQNTAPAGTESVACDDGQRVTLSDIAALATPDFESGWIAFQGSVKPYGYKAAHGLGVVPSRIKAIARCNTAENGYSVGDIVEINSDWTTIVGLYADATDVMFICYYTTQIALIPLKDGSNYAKLTPANWDVKLFAWV